MVGEIGSSLSRRRPRPLNRLARFGVEYIAAALTAVDGGWPGIIMIATLSSDGGRP